VSAKLSNVHVLKRVTKMLVVGGAAIFVGVMVSYIVN